MILGDYQSLEIARDTNQGLYLTDGVYEVLLPRRQCPPHAHIGEPIRVFVLTDSEDRPIATTKVPYGKVGDFAALKVVTVADSGAFLDWGLDKDLFCPFKEQIVPMKEGQRYVVRIYIDQASERIVCTSKIHKFLRPTGEDLKPGQPVKVMIAGFTPNAATVIVNNEIKASIFNDEIYENLRVGDVRDGFVKSIRPQDQKVAISLRPVGYQSVLGEREKLLAALKKNGGFLPLSDRSTPEEIHRALGLSKGAFKKLIGALYKEGIIQIETHVIRLKG
ncbi:MAG: hypothetical protein BGO01_01575 [Armatimonadetes bacterium 55-13]|nr:GntR family transcriptional regulator [Armatimonadota bacterium]OJU65635.1 MAG: hypothetical protein BGO01_01575 [Armatimonadetes bacterium 55-13]